MSIDVKKKVLQTKIRSVKLDSIQNGTIWLKTTRFAFKPLNSAQNGLGSTPNMLGLGFKQLRLHRNTTRALTRRQAPTDARSPNNHVSPCFTAENRNAPTAMHGPCTSARTVTRHHTSSPEITKTPQKTLIVPNPTRIW